MDFNGLKVETIVPIKKIEDIVKEELNHTVKRGRELAPVDYNQALEFSAMHLLVNQKIPELPEELGQVRHEAEYEERLDNYLAKFHLEAPKPQVLFEGRDAKNRVIYSLHLAEILGHEKDTPKYLHISDLVLQNPNIRVGRDERLEEGQAYKGLGNGIFDKILGTIESYARIKGYAGVSLLAAYPWIKDLLRSRRYKVEDNFLGQIAFLNQRGFPMFKQFDQK